jgi:hypothetical protein
MHAFKATIQIIGINPYVSVPEKVLEMLFEKAGRDKGKIPIHGTVNEKPYTQTLVKYSGEWRLYINTTMLKDSPKRIGETIAITVAYDPADRTIAPHPQLTQALAANKEAKAVFDQLRPSLQHEIVRYISHLKTVESIDRNVQKAINFLLGKGRFIGRDKP